jgi:hypothetical protein
MTTADHWFWLLIGIGIFGAGFVLGGLTELGASINALDRRLRHRAPPTAPPGSKPPARPSR